MSLIERGFAHIIKNIGNNKRSWESTIKAYLNLGDEYVYAGTITPDEGYIWKKINVTSILDMNTKVAAAKMYLKHKET